MRLEAGPIPLLELDAGPLAPEPPSFAALVDRELAELPQHEGFIDAALADAAAIDISSDLAGMDDNLSLAVSGFQEGAAIDPEQGIPEIEAAFTASADELDTANLNLPSEAWEPVPVPVTYIGGLGGPEVVAQGKLTFKNLTHPENAQQIVGQDYEADVQLISGSGGQYKIAAVSLTMTLGNANTTQPAITLGATDQYGRLKYRGTWRDGDEGNWTARLETPGGGVLASTAVNVIKPNSEKPGAGWLVDLKNDTQNRYGVFAVGDHFTLTLQGKPGDVVTMHGSSTAGASVDLELGTIGADGSLVLHGVIEAGTVGTWVEVYYFNGVRYPNDTSFVISA